MTAVSPIFPISQPQHYSDYGFDPQIDYFQILEEATRHSSKRTDSVHFKLQKPISKEHSKKRKSKWWKSALNFWKKSTARTTSASVDRNSRVDCSSYCYRGVTSPVYVTESVSMGNALCRSISRSASGPLVMAEVGDEGEMVPYVSLKEVDLTGGGHRISAASAPIAMPIYLVT